MKLLREMALACFVATLLTWTTAGYYLPPEHHAQLAASWSPFDWWPDWKPFLKGLLPPWKWPPLLEFGEAECEQGTLKVEIPNAGPVCGKPEDGIVKFLGIPYADPPVGDRRWEPPQPPAGWKTPRPPKAGSPCPQQDSSGAYAGDEDCLYLNVYRPSPENFVVGPGFPVMVWIHGGCGCGDHPPLSFNPPLPLTRGDYFGPTPLVKKGVVVVTFNYRLGVLGRFAHPALAAEDGPKYNPNYGLLDQQRALDWVQENIAAFVGDKTNVTIFGVSGGGIGVYAQLGSPQAKGKFKRAIAQSVPFGHYPTLSLDAAEATGKALAASLGCGESDTADCLRKLPASALIATQSRFPAKTFLYPIVDKKLDGTFTKLNKDTTTLNADAVMLGFTHDEWRDAVAMEYEFASSPKLLLTDNNYPCAVKALLGPGADEDLTPVALETYVVPPSAPVALANLGTDFLFACPARRAAMLLSDKNVPTYAYEFNDEAAPSGYPTSSKLFPSGLGAAHFSDVQYLFNLNGKETFESDGSDSPSKKLSEAMINYWTQFAKEGKAASWPPYSETSKPFLSLAPAKLVPTPDKDFDHNCWLWDIVLDDMEKKDKF